jgi:Uma2 family endonuclease
MNIPQHLQKDFLNNEKGNAKNEYHFNQLLPLSRNSKNHNLLKVNVIAALAELIKEGEKHIYLQDILVYAPGYDGFYYPDIVIVEGHATFAENLEIDVLVNPTIIIEIYSAETENYDRVDKFAAYRTIRDLKQYVLISETEESIEVYSRIDERNWMCHFERGTEGKILVDTCEVLSGDIYRNVWF